MRINEETFFKKFSNNFFQYDYQTGEYFRLTKQNDTSNEKAKTPHVNINSRFDKKPEKTQKTLLPDDVQRSR